MDNLRGKELRIGNYIGFGSLYCKVIEIQKECFYVEDIIEKQEFKNTTFKLEPIQLTEELLLKCGFELNNGCFIFNNGCFELRYDNGSFYFIIENQHLYLEINSLHQLQNIFFALTNKELKINL